MTIFFKKHFLLILILLFLNACQLEPSKKKHGILYLKNRFDKLNVNKDNKNDIIDLFGSPHSVSVDDKDSWIYIERVFEKGKFHKLGQNILLNNNVLVLTFDKYGILKSKNFLNKNDINKLTFSKKTTENDLEKNSFIESFLNSIKAKMYSNRK